MKMNKTIKKFQNRFLTCLKPKRLFKTFAIIACLLVAGAFLTLGGNVIVKDGQLNVTNDFFVGTDVLFVDSAGSKVGIGTTSPNEKLTVVGNVNITQNITIGDKLTFAFSELIDNLVNGWLRVTGSLNITGDITIGKQTLTGLCPDGWVMVPGNASLGTIDFCVMKYEAKARDGVAQSVAEGTPWVGITQTSSISECKEIGAHLCTTQEVLTINRDIESVASNWNNGIGSCLYGGHMDKDPASALAANESDDYPYSGTNDFAGDTFECPFDVTIGASDGKEQRRTFTLSNGEVIWDWSGNVREWMVNTCTNGTGIGAWDGDAAWDEWSSSEFDDYERATIGPSNSLWNSNNGTGKYYGCPTEGNGFLRGGYWSNGADAGVFSLTLYPAPSASNPYGGFRCCK